MWRRRRTRAGGAGRPVARVHGQTFRHYATALAETTFVLGEFPWQVRVGDREEGRDFINPPRLLSAETTAGETAWSLAEYVEAPAVWKAFGLPGLPPKPTGVYANQPSPHRGRAGRMWRTFLLLGALFVGVLVWRYATAANAPVASGRFRFTPALAEQAEDAEVGPFELTGRPAALRVEVETDVDSSWAALDFQLVELDSGRVAFLFLR